MGHGHGHHGDHGGRSGFGLMVIGVAVVGYIFGMATRGSEPVVKEYPAAAGPGYYEPLPAVGPADAPVVVTQVADYRCPYCAQHHGLVKRLMMEHKDDVRFVFKHRPIVDPVSSSEAAAVAAMAANRQKKFWEYSEQLFLNQREAPGWDEDKFVEYAARIGLNTEAFREALRDPSLRSYVRKDNEAAERLGIRSTPQLFVNGRPVPRWAEADDVRTLIKESAEQVRRLVAEGKAESIPAARAVVAARESDSGDAFAQIYINNDVSRIDVDLRRGF